MCAIVVLLAFIIMAAKGKVMIVLLPSGIIASIISYAIYNKKPWTVIVVTLVAAFSIINNLIQLPGSSFLNLILIAILVFEIYFFNHKAVKHHFGVKHTTTLF